MATQKVAVVTGSNRGIGLAVVKKLSRSFGGLVYLAARNEEAGKKAVADLEKEGYGNVSFLKLDIENQQSIDNAAKTVSEAHGGIDLLVNNAAILYDREFYMMIGEKCPTESTKPFAEEAEHTIRVNYFGTLAVCTAFFPLLRPNARVVNVASDSGMLVYVKSEELRNRLSNEKVTIEQLNELMTEFVETVKNGTHVSLGFPADAYSMSKCAIIALTRVQQRNFDSNSRSDVVVNSCCPGYIATGMTHQKGTKTPDQGAQTIELLAVSDFEGKVPRGQFSKSMRQWNWEDLNYVWNGEE